MGKILANQSFRFNTINGHPTEQPSIDVVHLFDKAYVIEVGFANVSIDPEIEVLITFGQDIFLVLDSTIPISERIFHGKAAYDACIVTVRLKGGVTSGGPYSINMDYTISAVHG